jgi:hypothetical protein
MRKPPGLATEASAGSTSHYGIEDGDMGRPLAARGYPAEATPDCGSDRDRARPTHGPGPRRARRHLGPPAPSLAAIREIQADKGMEICIPLSAKVYARCISPSIQTSRRSSGAGARQCAVKLLVALTSLSHEARERSFCYDPLDSRWPSEEH